MDICETVEFFFRNDPATSSRCNKCALWGVVFIYEPDETKTPPALPTPPPA